MREAELVVKVLTWLGTVVLDLIRGEDSEPVRRLRGILPDELRSDVEHNEQRRLMLEELDE